MHRILPTLLAFSAILLPVASLAQGPSSPAAVNRHQAGDGVISLVPIQGSGRTAARMHA